MLQQQCQQQQGQQKYKISSRTSTEDLHGVLHAFVVMGDIEKLHCAAAAKGL